MLTLSRIRLKTDSRNFRVTCRSESASIRDRPVAPDVIDGRAIADTSTNISMAPRSRTNRRGFAHHVVAYALEEGAVERALGRHNAARCAMRMNASLKPIPRGRAKLPRSGAGTSAVGCPIDRHPAGAPAPYARRVESLQRATTRYGDGSLTSGRPRGDTLRIPARASVPLDRNTCGQSPRRLMRVGNP